MAKTEGFAVTQAMPDSVDAETSISVFLPGETEQQSPLNPHGS